MPLISYYQLLLLHISNSLYLVRVSAFIIKLYRSFDLTLYTSFYRRCYSDQVVKMKPVGVPILIATHYLVRSPLTVPPLILPNNFTYFRLANYFKFTHFNFHFLFTPSVSKQNVSRHVDESPFAPNIVNAVVAFSRPISIL